MRYAAMLVTILVVSGAMFGTLAWFFRRLRVIEEERRGPRASIPLREQVRATLRRLRSLRTG